MGLLAVGDMRLKETIILPLVNRVIEILVDTTRGGSSKYGSLIWTDYTYTLLAHCNPNYPKQVVGHTPVSDMDDWNILIGIDTFSLTREGYPIGEGDLLFIEGETA
ncbi:hypothetical protein IGI37_003360 [Enterococcus sp. AZ194]|uniref:hypothetical protein n=1 Tax=Enterococcus sp. AZ194 TaxID=2774629 RepID=UPI003F235AEE